MSSTTTPTMVTSTPTTVIATTPMPTTATTSIMAPVTSTSASIGAPTPPPRTSPYQGINPAFRGMPVPTCPVFNHAQSDPDFWLKSFDCSATIYNLADEHRLMHVRLHLDQEAAKWLDTVPAEQVNTWDKFCRAFLSRWDQSSSMSKFNKFSTLKQQPTQSVRDFVTKVQHAAVPLHYTEEQLLPYLLDKVLPSLKPDIIRADPSSVTEFIEAATRAEAIATAQSQILNVQPDIMQVLISEIRNLKTHDSQTQVSSLHAPELADNPPAQFHQPQHQGRQRKASHHQSHPPHYVGNAPRPTNNPYYGQKNAYENSQQTFRSKSNGRRNDAPRHQFQPRQMAPNNQNRQMQQDNNYEAPHGYGQSYQPDFKAPQCYTCQGWGHFAKDCPNCTKCGLCHPKSRSCPNYR